jgi:hypothetical protein
MPIRVLCTKIHDMCAGSRSCAQPDRTGSRVKRFDHKNDDSSRSAIHNGYLAFSVAWLPRVSRAAADHIAFKLTLLRVRSGTKRNKQVGAASGPLP